MRSLLVILYILSSSIIFIGCSAPYAPVQKNKTLTIYTDVLSPQDTSIFSFYAKKEKVKIEIINVSMDSLLKVLPSLQKLPDLYIFSSIVDAKLYEKKAQLFSYDKFPYDNLLDEKYISKSQSFFAVFKDPYVFYNKVDSLHKFKTYDELTYSHLVNYWQTDLSNKELTPFLSGIAVKMGTKSNEKWLINFVKNLNLTKHRSDSLDLTTEATTIFTKYSLISDSLRKFSNKIIIPNQIRTGALNSYICAGIAAQSPNFTEAQKFLKILLGAQAQYLLREKKGYFSVLDVKPRAYLDSRQNLKDIEKFVVKVKRLLP